MDLNELLYKVREALPHAQPHELTRLLLSRALDYGDEAELILFPAVLAYVQNAERTRVREKEEEVFGTGPSSTRNPEMPRPAAARTSPFLNPAQESMRKLLSEGCYVPGHGHVAWGAMTSEMHRLRIAYLEGLRDNLVAGITVTIRRHQFAIGLLTESGVTALDDYVTRYGELPADLVPPDDGEVPTG